MLGKILGFGCMHENKIFFIYFFERKLIKNFETFFLIFKFFRNISKKMRYFNTRSVSYSINILPNILQFFERTFKIYFNFVLFFKILYIIIILLNINWVGPARLSPVGLTYGPTDPYSSCCFFLGWAGLGLAI